MPLRRAHAPPSEFRFCRFEKPLEQCEQYWLSSQRTEEVYKSTSFQDLPDADSLLGSIAQSTPSYDRTGGTRLKPREENNIRWVDLLEKFKLVQERARRSQAAQRQSLGPTDSLDNPSLAAALSVATTDRVRDRSGHPDLPRGLPGALNPGSASAGLGVPGPISNRMPDSASKPTTPLSILGPPHKHKSSLPNLGRLGIGGRKSKR